MNFPRLSPTYLFILLIFANGNHVLNAKEKKKNNSKR